MVPTQTLETYPPFGDNATKVQPDNAKYAAGFQPADVYPAEWVNWAWGKNTRCVTDLNAGVNMMEKEINNVLDGAGKSPDATKENQLLQSIQKLISDAETRAKLAAHPVGSLYWSSDSTDPGTLFGGTWARIKDKFILAAGDTYTNGSTGGAATVTLTTEQIPSHTHTFTGSEHSHTYTPAGKIASTANGTDNKTASESSHTHGYSHTHKYTHTHGYTPAGKVASAASGTNNKTADGGGWSFTATTMTGNDGVSRTILGAGTNTTSTTASSSDFSRLTIWGAGVTKQTITGSSHSHAAYFTGTAGTTTSQSADTTTNQSATTTGSGSAHSHAAYFTGTQATLKATAGGSNGNTGGGGSHENMPPYLVKYCWERTA